MQQRIDLKRDTLDLQVHFKLLFFICDTALVIFSYITVEYLCTLLLPSISLYFVVYIFQCKCDDNCSSKVVMIVGRRPRLSSPYK